MENEKKKKRFKPFDIARDGKGISKKDAELGDGLRRFFLLYKNNFGKLVSVNIFFVLGNFPLFFLIAALAGVSKNQVTLPLSDLFQNILGIFRAEGELSPYKLSLFALEGLQGQAFTNSNATYVLYALGALTLFTFGLVNVGTAYILRNMVSGEPVFLWNDFCYSVKRNYKQAIPFGIIDALICALLTFNIYNLVMSTGQFFFDIMFWSNIILAILYFFMRYYMYVQMVTFKLSVFKMFKNSLIFSLLGIKRNIMALLGILLLLVARGTSARK